MQQHTKTVNVVPFCIGFLGHWFWRNGWSLFLISEWTSYRSRSTPSSRLCSDHFVVGDFVNKVKYEYGYAPHLDVHPTAVPSVHKQPPETETTASATARRQNIAEESSRNSKKRNAMKVSDQNTHWHNWKQVRGWSYNWIPASFLFERFGSKRYGLAPKHSLYSTTAPSTSLHAAMTGFCHYVINENGYRGASSAFSALARTKIDNFEYFFVEFRSFVCQGIIRDMNGNLCQK